MTPSRARMIRSWSRLATSSRPASICSTRSFWAAARSSSACPCGAEPVGVEPRLEQVDERRGEGGVGDERADDVLLAEGRPGLAQVLGDRPQDDDLAPGEPGAEDQGVEAVALGAPVPHRGERVLEQLAHAVVAPAGPDLRPRRLEPEVVDVDAQPVGAPDLVRTLVDDLDAEVGEQRQHRGQRQRATAVELEPALVGGAARLLVEVQPDRVLVLAAPRRGAGPTTATRGLKSSL